MIHSSFFIQFWEILCKEGSLNEFKKDLVFIKSILPPAFSALQFNILKNNKEVLKFIDLPHIFQKALNDDFKQAIFGFFNIASPGSAIAKRLRSCVCDKFRVISVYFEKSFL